MEVFISGWGRRPPLLSQQIPWKDQNQRCGTLRLFVPPSSSWHDDPSVLFLTVQEHWHSDIVQVFHRVIKHRYEAVTSSTGIRVKHKQKSLPRRRASSGMMFQLVLLLYLSVAPFVGVWFSFQTQQNVLFRWWTVNISTFCFNAWSRKHLNCQTKHNNITARATLLPRKKEIDN